MDERILHFDWNWQLNSSAEELWALVSDTNRLYKNLNLPPVQAADLSYDIKEGFTQLSYNSIKNSDAWEEEPFEWERPFRYGVNRRYKNGSYHHLKVQVDLLPNQKGTRVRYQIWATTRNVLARFLISLRFKTLFRRRLKKTLRRYDELLQEGLHPYEQNSKKRLIRGGLQRVKKLKQELNTKTAKPQIVFNLTEYIKYADVLDVTRIEPFELADHWQLPRKDVLDVFLYATKVGLLNFNWDLYCTKCRSIQHTCSTLNEVHEPIFCEECQDEFFMNFDRNVKLSFRPNPLIRKVPDENWCITGPQTKPHIKVKQYLKPGQKRYLKIELEEGEYDLRIHGEEGSSRIIVGDVGRDNITVSLTRQGLNGEEVEITPEPNVVFHNNTNTEKIFILEKANWQSDTLTAARVTSLQLFRDLFDKEVLRKGEKIAVNSQTLMFTDLLDSTGMYNKEGDQTAVGRVIEHFDILQEAIAEQDGAIVKTIGDSVMAVFSNPADAIRAFLQAYDVISQENGLKLKAGIHHGSCLAVNLNNRIDYFGSTVNIASRLVEFADEDEVVLSDSVSQVLEQLQNSEKEFLSKDLNVKLRGFDDEHFKIKRVALNKSALRLVV